jgi:hypothetical protein
MISLWTMPGQIMSWTIRIITYTRTRSAISVIRQQLRLRQQQQQAMQWWTVLHCQAAVAIRPAATAGRLAPLLAVLVNWTPTTTTLLPPAVIVD